MPFVDPESAPRRVKTEFAKFDPDLFIDPDEPDIPAKPKKFNEKEFKDPDSAFMAGVTGFTRGIEETVEGALQLGAKGLEKAGVPTQSFQRGISDVRQRKEAEYQQAKKAHPGATVGGYLGGLVGTGLAVPGGKAGQLGRVGGVLRGISSAAGPGLVRTATGALAGAGLGASQFVEEGQSRAKNALLGGIIGGSLPALISGIKGIGGKLIGGKGKVAKDILSEVDIDSPMTQKGIKAAKEADITLTPGEISQSPLQLAKEGRIPIGKTAQRGLSKKLDLREHDIYAKTKGVIDDIVPEGDKVAAKNAEDLYSSIRNEVLPDEIQKKILKDPILAKNFELVRKNVDYRMDQFDKGAIGQFDELKQFIDSKIAQGKTAGAINKNLIAAKNKLMKEIDEYQPDYKEARAVSQRIILKRNLLDKVDKIRVKSGQETPTVSQLYDNLFGSASKQKEFLKTIKTAGSDTKQAKNMITVLNRLRGTQIQKVLTKDPRFKSTQFGGGPTSYLWESVNRLRSGRYNKVMLDLMVDPRWSEKVAEIASKEARGGIVTGLAALASKVSAISVANGEGSTPVEPSQTLNMGTFVDPDTGTAGLPEKPVNSVTEALTPKLQDELKTVQESATPKEQGFLDKVLTMTPGEYFDEYLSTPEKQEELVKFVHQNKGNSTQLVSNLRKLKRLENHIKTENLELRNLIEEQSQFKKRGFNIFKAILMAIIAALVGGWSGAALGFLAGGFGQGGSKEAKKERKKREKELKKEIKSQRRLLERLGRRKVNTSESVFKGHLHSIIKPRKN